MEQLGPGLNIIITRETHGNRRKRTEQRSRNPGIDRPLRKRISRQGRRRHYVFLCPGNRFVRHLSPARSGGSRHVRETLETFFESHQGPIHVEFPDVIIAAGDDVAFSYCVHRIKGTLKNGQQTDWWLRWTACYRKINGKW